MCVCDSGRVYNKPNRTMVVLMLEGIETEVVSRLERFSCFYQGSIQTIDVHRGFSFLSGKMGKPKPLTIFY